MKHLHKNIRKVVIFLCVLLTVLVSYGIYQLTFSSGRWFSSSWNSYLRSQKKQVIPGNIYDINGTVLASVDKNGNRLYADSAALRKAVVHVIGDRAEHIRNSVESFMTGYLYGFQQDLSDRLWMRNNKMARQGDSIVLTINGSLCQYIASVFPTGHAGAVIVMNYKTGAVLASQSFPDYDPDDVSSTVLSNRLQPFFNRAVQGLYAPGSTFKIVTAACALENMRDVETKQYHCTGSLDLNGRIITDAGGSAHGTLNMAEAFVVSCNNTFAQLALELGDNKLKKTAESFGLNDHFLFRDMVVEDSSYPVKNRNQGEIAWTGAGQSALLVTPMHMCMIGAAIANDGVMMEPRLLDKVIAPGGRLRLSFTSNEYRRAVSEKTAEYIKDYMRSVVLYGTGTKANLKGYQICGKTGSAELDTQENTNAWFVGFLDEEEFPYAVTVLVENAGSGGSVAAPIAKKVFQWLVNAGH